MKIRFFTDPHLGCDRKSHTTPASRKRLQDALYRAALEATDTNDPVFCLGDLFDKHHNDEIVIAQGGVVARRCAAVLAGNHDMSNRADTLSSLQLLGQDDGVRVLDLPGFSDEYECGEVLLAGVPHCLSQEDFESGLDGVCSGRFKRAGCSVLILHCNYDNSFAEAKDQSLNLTRERAEGLMKVYDFILIGHEHVARADFGGRLQVLGNIHPTSFADISSKYWWTLDTEAKTLAPTLCWGAQNSARVAWDNLEGDVGGVQFLDITGATPRSERPRLAKAIHGLWQSRPDLLMLRDGTLTEDGEGGGDGDKAVERLGIEDRIRRELNGDALELFDRYVEALKGEDK